MIRLFDIGRPGRVYELSEGWHMLPDPEGVGKSAGYANALPESKRTVTVPSCWNGRRGWPGNGNSRNEFCKLPDGDGEGVER